MIENLLENIIPEENLKFAFMRKAFFPRTVIVGSFFEYLKTAKIAKPFLFFSQTVAGQHEEKISALFPEAKMRLLQGEPTSALRDDLAREVRSFAPDALIAIGGGSVLDLAKIIKKETGLPLVVAPTTPGTGSENTPYALLVDEEKKTKVLIRSFQLLPDVAVLDYSFLESIPFTEMGYFIFDILGHCAEGLVSRMSTQFSDIFARQGIENINKNYSSLVPPYPKETLENMQTAGFLGGIVQSMASVGMAHSFAHHFGPRLGLSHARSLSIFLPEVIRINASRSASIYEKLEFSGGKGAEPFLALLADIKRFFEIPQETIRVGKSFNKQEAISAMKRDFCAPTNPVRFEDKDFNEIFSRVLRD